MMTEGTEDEPSPPESIEGLQESVKEVMALSDPHPVRSLLDRWHSSISLPKRGSEDLEHLVTQAARDDHPQILDYLLDHGGEVFYATTLTATDCASAEVFQVFLDHGWDINSTDQQDGNTILSHILSRPPLVEWFLIHGADPNIPNKRELYPLETAAHHASLATVQLLLSYGAKLGNSRAMNDAAAAKGPGRLPVLEYLLRRGANIHALAPEFPQLLEAHRSSRNGTALHSAAMAGNTEAVELSLLRGADKKKNEEGATPEQCAAKFNYTELSELLSVRQG